MKQFPNVVLDTCERKAIHCHKYFKWVNKDYNYFSDLTNTKVNILISKVKLQLIEVSPSLILTVQTHFPFLVIVYFFSLFLTNSFHTLFPDS